MPRRKTTPSTEAPPKAEKAADAIRLALESGRVGTWHWDVQSQHVEWSDNMERIHGMPPGSFDGSFGAFESAIHPEDRERVLTAVREAVEGVTEEYHVDYRN